MGDMMQASVSALCSTIYIGSALTRGVEDPTTSVGSRIFFCLSIASSIFTVVGSFILLYLRERLLKRPSLVDRDGKGQKRISTVFELGSVYDTASNNSILNQDNPMHNFEPEGHQ